MTLVRQKLIVHSQCAVLPVINHGDAKVVAHSAVKMRHSAMEILEIVADNDRIRVFYPIRAGEEGEFCGRGCCGLASSAVRRQAVREEGQTDE